MLPLQRGHSYLNYLPQPYPNLILFITITYLFSLWLLLRYVTILSLASWFTDCLTLFWKLQKVRDHIYMFILAQASLVAQLVKNPPAMQETLVQFLGREDPPEKG